MSYEIDGAKTLLIGKSENESFGFVDWFDGSCKKIKYLSINKYENDDSFYLFLLDEQFETLSDYFEDSVDEAKGTANQLFPNIKIRWENFIYK